MADYKRILLIQTAFLGDAILTTPLVRALKKTYPDAKLDVLCIPETAIVFKHNPHINRILLFDKRDKVRRVQIFLPLIWKIRAGKYDLAVSAQLHFTNSVLMFCAGIRNRLGFPRQKLITMTIDLAKGIQVVKRYLKLMTALTAQEFDYQTELFWDVQTAEKVDAEAGDYLKTHQTVVGIAPGSVWPTKRWLPGYFADLIRELDNKNVKTVLIGGKEDYQLCREIAIMSQTEPLNLAGSLSLLGSAALIEKLKLVVTNDSAPLHLANAVQTDVIAIFGPTVKSFGFYPFRDNDKVIETNLPCRPCGKHGSLKCPLKHFNCMKNITPDIVLKEVLAALERR